MRLAENAEESKLTVCIEGEAIKEICTKSHVYSHEKINK